MNSKYKEYLKMGLETIFRDELDRGFWNERDGRIIYRLLYKHSSWIPDNRVEFRYAPFGLMGVLYWRYTNQLTATMYDTKMLSYLDFLSKNISTNGKVNNDSSGFDYAIVLSVLALGYLNFRDSEREKANMYIRKAKLLYEYISETWNQDTIIEPMDLFILWAYDWFYEAMNKKMSDKTENIETKIKEMGDWIVCIQDDNGIFRVGDKRENYHQALMYTLWGLGRAAKIMNNDVYLEAIEKTLDYVINNRLEKDGAFKWHPFLWSYKCKNSFLRWHIRVNPYGTYFYECHQTFFVNAVEQYYYGGGSKGYIDYELKAIEWIFNTNRRGVNMVNESGIGVPLRMMNSVGKVNVRKNNFKGAYEVGSYIMALSDINYPERIKIMKERPDYQEGV